MPLTPHSALSPSHSSCLQRGLLALVLLLPVRMSLACLTEDGHTAHPGPLMFYAASFVACLALILGLYLIRYLAGRFIGKTGKTVFSLYVAAAFLLALVSGLSGSFLIPSLTPILIAMGVHPAPSLEFLAQFPHLLWIPAVLLGILYSKSRNHPHKNRYFFLALVLLSSLQAWVFFVLYSPVMTYGTVCA